MASVDRKEADIVQVRKSDLESPIVSAVSTSTLVQVEFESTVAATSWSIPGTTTTEKLDWVFEAHLSVSLT